MGDVYDRLALRYLRPLLFAGLVLATLIGFASPVLNIGEKIGHNDNEGWNAFHQTTAIEGGDLYPDLDELVSNNYPPLSYYVVGAASLISGDTLRTGRAVALLSLLIVALCTGLIASSLTGSRFAGFFGAVLLLGYFSAEFQNYIAMNDPQMLGHAFQYTGLAIFVRLGRRRSWMLVSLVLLILGGLVKHNLILIPFGITLWLFIERRRDFWIWLGGAAILSAVAVVALRALYGPEFFAETIHHARTYGAILWAFAFERWFIPLVPLLVGGLGALLFRDREPRKFLLVNIALPALLLGALAAGGSGMNYNAIFDLAFILTTLCAIGVHHAFEMGRHSPADAESRVRWPWTGPVYMLGVLLSIVFMVPMNVYNLYEDLRLQDERRATAAADLAFVAQQPGSAMCQDPAVCYWAGKRYEVDFFNLSQKFGAGAMDGSELAALVENRQFGVIQVRTPRGSGFLHDRVNEAILEHYELARTSSVNGYFFVPRAQDDPAP